MKKDTTKNMLIETSLSRLYQHAKKGFFLLSAFRDRNEFDENVTQHRKLEQDLRKKDLGFIHLFGKWIGEYGAPAEEWSIFVPYREEYEPEEFIQIAYKLGNKYNQEAIIYKAPEAKNVMLKNLDSNEEINLGSFRPDRIAQEYSTIKYGKHAGRSFVFEGIRAPSNYISATMMRLEGHLL